MGLLATWTVTLTDQARTISLLLFTMGSSPTTRRSSSSSPPRASSSSRTQTPRQWPSWSSTSTGGNFSNKKLQIDFYSQSPGSTFRQLVEQTISQLEVTIICSASTIFVQSITFSLSFPSFILSFSLWWPVTPHLKKSSDFSLSPAFVPVFYVHGSSSFYKWLLVCW